MCNTKISHNFCTDYTCTSVAETLEVIQGNFVSEKAFWSPYLWDGIKCSEIRVQIWIKPLSKICGFLAVKGEHNRILAHMPCTSARSSAGCQYQSVHHSTHSFSNHRTKKSSQHRDEPNQSVLRLEKQTFKENEMPPLIGCNALVSPPPQPIDNWEISSRQLLTLLMYNHCGCTLKYNYLPFWSRI